MKSKPFSILRFLQETFNWDQFSSTPSSSDDDDPILGALNKALQDPEGKQAIASHQQQKLRSLEDLLPTFRDLLFQTKKINVDYLKKLGSGAGGIAYQMDENRVLKVTSDESEARSSNGIKGKQLPGIIHIQDVWQFPNTKYYGIVMEAITPFKQWPNDSLKNNLEEIVDTYNLKSLLQKHGGNMDAIWKEISSDPGFSLAGDPKQLQTAFGTINKIMQEIKKAGINNFFDLHLDNLGKRKNGEIVVFDLGFSEGGSNPPVLGQQQQQQNLSERGLKLGSFIWKKR